MILQRGGHRKRPDGVFQSSVVLEWIPPESELHRKERRKIECRKTNFHGITSPFFVDRLWVVKHAVPLLLGKGVLQPLAVDGIPQIITNQVDRSFSVFVPLTAGKVTIIHSTKSMSGDTKCPFTGELNMP